MTAIALDIRPDRASETERAQLMGDPGFGRVFTDHMVTATVTREGVSDAQVRAFGPLTLDPAACTFHYGQEIFEGLKAYRHADGSIWGFRPDMNAARFTRSAERLALPLVPEDFFVDACARLVEVDRDWVPAGEEQSLYLRPFEIATEAYLGVRPADVATFCVIASPVGMYFPNGIKPVSLWVSRTFSRAGRGGTGAAKCGGNYAASMAAQLEARERGCDQSVFLDSTELRYIEELGGMNLMFVTKDGGIVTPELSGSILEGITRDSLITLARSQGRSVEERKVDIAEWVDGVRSGDIVEAFACGTAAVLAPVGRLVDRETEIEMPGLEAHHAGTSVAMQLRKALVDLQFGRAEDTFGWTVRWA